RSCTRRRAAPWLEEAEWRESSPLSSRVPVSRETFGSVVQAAVAGPRAVQVVTASVVLDVATEFIPHGGGQLVLEIRLDARAATLVEHRSAAERNHRRALVTVESVNGPD